MNLMSTEDGENRKYSERGEKCKIGTERVREKGEKERELRKGRE